MAEFKFDAQVNYGWGLTLNMTGKAPAVSKRIFSTLADAQAFADDYNDSAIEGIILSVIADGNNNGAYFVQSIKSSADGASAVLVKMGTAAGATGELGAALEALDLADTAVEGEYVSAVSQEDGQISVTRAKLSEAVVGTDEEGNNITLSDKFESISQEISDAQEAAASAATKLAKDEAASNITLSESTDEETGAITYTIGQTDIASAALLGTAEDTAADSTAFGKIAAEADARKTADKAITGFEESYTANANSNYITAATDLNNADVLLDAQIKKVANDVAALTGGEEGAGAISDQIDTAVNAAKEEINGTIADLEEAYKAADETLTQGVADNKSAIEEVEGNLSDLDEAVADFKNKTVATTITAPGSDEVLPTTKAVVDYISASTEGVANNMTYTAKEGDDSKMELKLIAVDGSTLSTIELDKENFLSNFVKRAATAEDAAADASISEGDPILVVTMTNGDVFSVNLKSLVDVYTGVANQAITTEVDGYVVKATLNVDSAADTNSAVKLTVGDNGLSAALAIDSAKNGANGITLAQDGNGLSAALKIDEEANTANGTVMTVGAEGLSVALVWTEL